MKKIVLFGDYNLINPFVNALNQLEFSAEFQLVELAKDLSEELDLDEDIFEYYLHNKKVKTIVLSKFDYQADIFIFAGELKDIELVAKMAEKGAKVVDLSGFTNNIGQVFTLALGVNEEQILAEIQPQQQIMAIANPIVSQVSLALKPLLDKDIILDQVIVSSYLPTAFVDYHNLEHLGVQSAKLLNGLPNEDDKKLAFNILPHKIKANLEQQANKIFKQNNLKFHFLQAQMPVFFALTQSIKLLSSQALDEVSLKDFANEYINLTEQATSAYDFNQNEDKIHQLDLSIIEQNVDEINLWSVCDLSGFNYGLRLANFILKLLAK